MSGFSRPSVLSVPSFNRTTHSGISKHDLERDSGFSDASSEYLSAVEVMDSEDAGRNGSVVGQEIVGPQLAVVGGSYPGLSPMIIMNNFVLKQQPSMDAAEKQWGLSSPMEVMPQSQVVLLQPMASNSSSRSSPKAKSYAPVLKSYPRIAPYPVDRSTKRVGSSKVTATAVGRDQRQRRHHHGQRVHSSPSPMPAQQMQIMSNFEAATSEMLAAQSQDLLSGKQAETNAVPRGELRTVPADQSEDPISMHSNKLKRFSNTYNILDKSGLLDITMRTKQLIKENKRTQGQLQQLQEQTALLLEALSSGDPHLWTKLQLSLQDTEKEHFGVKAQSVLV